MKLGFLYAGQGSQHPGMGADLYERFPTFRAVLDSAAAQVDFDLKEVSFTDAKGILNETRYTQPCMVAFAAGMTALLAERGIVPAAAAGLSLGEYSALHAAGVFDADTAVELVAFRGKAMEEAAAGRPSAMVAVLGWTGRPCRRPVTRLPPTAAWSSPTTTAPASWSSAARRPPWRPHRLWQRKRAPAAVCL